jgi:hypothetical protein
MTEVLGTITNPLLQPVPARFGNNTPLTASVGSQVKQVRGNPVNALNQTLQYPPTTRMPTTITKSGESLNLSPRPLPAQEANILRPQYSSVSRALIEQPRVGVQLGMADMRNDNPYSDWTYGQQYYTIYVGDNPRQRITPVIYPQAWRPSEWAQPSVDFPQVNRENTQDITDLTMDNRYSCTSCEIASASLGTPVMYEPRNPTAPLPVAAYPGEFPYTGFYTAREIGVNTRDYPQPTNPIVDLQLRKAGLPTPPIQPNYDKTMLGWLRHGFNFN